MRNINLQEKIYTIDVEEYWGDIVFDKSIDIIKKFLTRRPIGKIIDIGANVGVMTLILHDNLPNAGVVAIEANPTTFQRLKNNVPFKCEFINSAIGDKPLISRMSSPDGSSGRYMFSNTGDEIQVNTLDSFNFQSVSLIKVDVEGADLLVLKGAINTINKNRPIIYFEHHDDLCNARELFPFIEVMNYNIVFLDNGGKFVPNIINTYILLPKEIQYE